MMFFKKNIFNNKKSGYTLLFAVLTAVLVLGVAVFILSVSRRQFLLAGTARESMYSIYAADSGIECAAKSAIASSSNPAVEPSRTNTQQIICNGRNITIPGFGVASNDPGYTNTRQSPDPNSDDKRAVIFLNRDNCATLMIKTTFNIDNNLPVTIVESRGYNICDENGPDITNPKIVERGLRWRNVGSW